MPSLRSALPILVGCATLAMPAAASALPTPKHVPAPHCAAGTVPVRGIVADDGHQNDEKGKGHKVHGNGFGYGHGCGGDGGNGGGGGGEPQLS